ncbi:uncharacterized protein LOC134254346 isoform X1 [Saccostrea cucullata]|uniref:uncharacterized protein LOC134254346 isoform X1 n=1 Tax=Saccostrea cuccullata TaxID=36930 RepID=UPI002ED271EA
MVKRCAFGLCNSDSRYPARNKGVIFYPFPKPKTDIDKCRRWIKACNRPHKQLNVDRITKNTYVCSKHFMNGCGPTPTYPDPIPLTSSTPKPSRPPPKNRGIFSKQSSESENQEDPDNQCEESSQHVTATGVSTCSQTEEKWVEPMDVLLLAAENKNILEENRSLNDLESFPSGLTEMSSKKICHPNLKKNFRQLLVFLTAQK